MSSPTNIALEYRIYRASDAEQVTEVLADVFSRHDPLAFAAHVTRAEFADFVRSLLPQAAKDRLTVVACLPATGEIVAVLLTNDAAGDSAAELSELNEKFRPIASILGELDDMYLDGREPPLGEMLHLYLLGVSDRFAGQGIGQELVLRTLENGVREGYRIAVAESTNRRSQRCASPKRNRGGERHPFPLRVGQVRHPGIAYRGELPSCGA
jgi:predicted N-acetyltransferase YhbS